MKVSVVMPAYNEAGCIEKVVGAWSEELAKVEPDFAMFVIDDGSKDNTPSILDSLASHYPKLTVFHKPNGGHGSALLYGYAKALEMGAEFIFQVDSDDQFSPSDFTKLWQQRSNSPFILGFREERHDPWPRMVITRTLRLLIAVMYGVWIKDSNVPYRLMRADVLKSFLTRIPQGTFAPNILLSVLAHKTKLNVITIPVLHVERNTGKVSIFGWKLFKICLRCAQQLLDFRKDLRSNPPTKI